jgi:hypothetical protein
MQKQTLDNLGVEVFWETNTWCFAQLNETEMTLLEARGFEIEIVDPDVSPGSYFMIHKIGPGKGPYPGQFLWEDNRSRLVQLTEAEANQLMIAGYVIVQLPENPHPLRNIEAPAPFFFPQQDTMIQRLINDVSEPALTQNILDLQNFNTRYTYSPICDSAIRYLYQRFLNYELATEIDTYVLNGDTSYNVIATQLGQAHPESILITCGHMDSYSNMPMVLAPGADDDASGVAAVLEIARVLSQADFRWTIKYIAFSGEEQWMKGSYHWVDSVAVPQNLLIEGVYNCDMIGYTAYDTNLMYVTPNIPSQPLAVLAETVNAQYNIGLNVNNYLDIDAYGDHTPFWDNGFKAAFVIEDSEWGIWNGSNPHYHTTHDTLGNLRMSLVHHTTQMVLGCLATLAGPVHDPGVEEEFGQWTNVPPCQLSILPNPMRQTCSIVIPWKVQGDYRLTVYDAAGRRLRQLSHHGSGNLTSWDGKDDYGRNMSTGVYFVRYLDNKRRTMAKIIRLE